jgi:hypothetical protein
MKKLGKAIAAVWTYLRPSLEGDDGKFSWKRATQFIFVWLMIFIVLRDQVQTEWQFYTFLTIAVLFSLTATIMTVSQLLIMFKAWSKKDKASGYIDSFNSNNEPNENIKNMADPASTDISTKH